MMKKRMRYLLVSLGIILPVFSTLIHLRSGSANNQIDETVKNAETKIAQKKKKPVSFTEDVLPLFVKPKKQGKLQSIPCIHCHFSSLSIANDGIPENAWHQLGMGSYRDIMAGADGGIVQIIDTENPSESELLVVLEGEGDESRMPYGGPFFSKKEIAVIRRWIEEGAKDDTPAPDFNRDVLPLLTKSVNGSTPCSLCHYNNNGATSKSRSESQSCLDLSTWEGIISGAEGIIHEAVIDLETPANSLILKRLRGQKTEEAPEDDHRMPFGGPYFTEYEIQKIERWIAGGAKGPKGEDPSEADISGAGECLGGSGSGSENGDEE